MRRKLKVQMLNRTKKKLKIGSVHLIREFIRKK